MSCPTYTCIFGATLSAALPMSFEEAEQATFSMCLNDTCFEGQLGTLPKPPVMGGESFHVPSAERIEAEMSDRATVAFFNDGNGSFHVRLEWTPWSDSELHDGDRYRLTATHPDGRTQLLIDQSVEYRDNSLPPPCPQTCHAFP
jgi:hypothetical protein